MTAANQGDDRPAITTADIRSAGGVEEALVQFCDHSFATAAMTSGAPELLLRDWVEDALITADGYRDQVIAGAADEVERLRALQDTHVLRVDVRGGRSFFEIAHDRLVQPILESNRVWRDEQLSPLQRAARAWRDGGEPDTGLMVGGALADAERWAQQHPDQTAEVDRAFLDASRAQAAMQRAAARRQRRDRIAAVGALALAAVAVAGLIFALRARGEANDQRDLAAERADALAEERDRADEERDRADEERDRAEDAADAASAAEEFARTTGIASEARALIDEDPELALLLAAEAWRRDQRFETERALLATATESAGLLGVAGVPDEADDASSWFPGACENLGASVLESGAIGVRWMIDGTVWEQPLGAPPAPTDRTLQVATDCVLYSGADWVVEFPAVGGAALSSVDDTGALTPRFATDAFVSWLASPDDDVDQLGLLVGTYGDAQDVVVVNGWRSEDPSVARFAVSPRAGSLVLDIDRNAALVLDTWAGRCTPGELQELSLVDGAVRTVATVASGGSLHALAGSSQVIVASCDGAVSRIDPVTGEVVTLVGPAGQQAEVAVSPAGDEIAVMVGDEVRFLRPIDGTETRPAVAGRAGFVEYVDDRTVAVLETIGGTTLFYGEDRGVTERLFAGEASFIDISSDGSTATLTTALSGETEVVDLATGDTTRLTLAADDPGRLAGAIAINPDAVYGLTFDLRIVSWIDGVYTGSSEPAEPDPGFGPVGADVCCDNRVAELVTSSTETRIYVYGLDPFEQVARLDVSDSGVAAFALNGPDAVLVAGLEPGEPLVLLDLDGNEVARADVDVFAVSVGNELIAATLDDGDVALLDRVTLEERSRIGVGDATRAQIAGADDRLLVYSPGRIELWDLDRAEKIGDVYTGPLGIVGNPRVVDEGLAVIVPLGTEILRVELDPDRWADRACAITQRELTAEEWARYVGPDEAPEVSCPRG